MVSALSELKHLAPEERIKRLQEIEARIEAEKNEQIKAAEEMIEETKQQIQLESEEEKHKRLFQLIDEESLESEIEKTSPKAEELESNLQYSIPATEEEQVIQEFQQGYKSDAKYEPNHKEKVLEKMYHTKTDEILESVGYKK